MAQGNVKTPHRGRRIDDNLGGLAYSRLGGFDGLARLLLPFLCRLKRRFGIHARLVVFLERIPLLLLGVQMLLHGCQRVHKLH